MSIINNIFKGNGMILRGLFVCVGLIASAGFAFAAPAGFVLRFDLAPAYEQLRDSKPAIWLDICLDSRCATADASIPLKCVFKKTADPETVSTTACDMRAVAGGNGTAGDAFLMLKHPVWLRLRVDSLQSKPFPFNGATPVKLYKFAVAVMPKTLQVTPR